MTKKKKLKFAIDRALKEYYESGFTNTANKVRLKMFELIDRIYTKNKSR